MARDDLAGQIRRIREDGGIQQQQLSNLTGIEISRLSRIETGKLEATQEEVMTILEAIDTDESRALAETVGQSLAYVQAPTWNALGADDRSALLTADRAIGKIDGARLPKSLARHVENLKQSLLDAASYLVNPHHPICMVGHIGVGKSTAANSIFNLTEGFAKATRRLKDSSATRGLLPTGGGGTTAFEFRLAYAPEPSIRIEPQREDKILAEIRELCAFWIADSRGEKRDRAVSSEMEKLYRNMAGLTRKGDNDPIKALIGPETDVDGLMFDVSGRLNLSVRTQTELLYKEDRTSPDQSEADWLQKRCDALNLGKIPSCPLPRRLEISLPNPALNAEGFRFTVIDLRGINTTDPRPDLHPDLVAAYSDPRALVVLCSNFLDAPDHCAQSVVEHLKARSAQNESPIDFDRVALLVLPRADEAESVRRDDGSSVDDRGEGYDLKRNQIADRLGETADKLAIRFFDARKDDAELTHGHILSRVLAIRHNKHAEINHLDAAVDNLLSDVGQAHFKETQNRVREKIAHVISTGAEAMDKGAAPTWTRLVRAIDQFHASSVWSIARGNGEGRSIDLYQVFAELLREDAKDRTMRPTTELRTLLKELLHHEDMRQSQMKRSKSFVAEIMTMIDKQHEAFLKGTSPIGLAALKQAFQNDHVFWDECAQLWGKGGGFRGQISKRTDLWFRRHPKLTERLDDRLQDLWDETFIDWLRSYLVGQ